MSIHLSITPTGHGPSELGRIGTVIDVIAGHLPNRLAERKFKASDYAYGFELGTPKNAQSLGEAIMANGVCYATSTDINILNEYYHLIYGPEFITSGIFIIPHEAEPSYRINFLMSTQPLNILHFYNQLYQHIREPFAFVALAEFVDFHATAISKPPINGVNIFKHPEEYYSHPDNKRDNVSAFVMGVITNYEDKQYAAINKELEVVLYNNPFDKTSELTHHAHVLTLKKSVNNLIDIKPQVADLVLHLYADTSAIKSIQADVYTISKIKDYE